MNVSTIKETISEKNYMSGLEEWKKVHGHAIKFEDEYRKFEPLFNKHK